MQTLYVSLTCKCLLRSILIYHLGVYFNISYISYQMEQVTFTHYISWYPYFYGLLIFCITYPHSLALYECVWSVSHSTCFTLRENARVPTEQKAGWAKDLAWKACRSEKSPDPARNLNSIIHSSIQATAYQPQETALAQLH